MNRIEKDIKEEKKFSGERIDFDKIKNCYGLMLADIRKDEIKKDFDSICSSFNNENNDNVKFVNKFLSKNNNKKIKKQLKVNKNNGIATK